jgi:hypothetical protein
MVWARRYSIILQGIELTSVTVVVASARHYRIPLQGNELTCGVGALF